MVPTRVTVMDDPTDDGKASTDRLLGRILPRPSVLANTKVTGSLDAS
jgi:hypothetical protein